MSKKTLINLFLLICCCILTAQAQTKSYQYKRQLTGIKAQWHTITLPNLLFKHTQSNLADVRIYGIKGTDTIEIPYLLKERNDEIKTKESSFKLLNESANSTGYYYTIQPQSSTALNQIKLSFKQTNFDWKVDLEGSNDNKQWFKLLGNYRILSIQNKATNYQFTDLNFSTANYGYYRIAIKAAEQPVLNEVKIAKIDTLNGIYKAIPYQSYQLTNATKTKESIINVTLPTPTPLSSIQLLTPHKTDFYRPLKIAFATDSFKTDKGMKFTYAPLYEGTLSSLEDQSFDFNSTLVKHLKITIENNDNQPLRITGVKLKGPIYQLLARFDDLSFQYALYYGNSSIAIPNYDLVNFESKIPAQVNPLTLGEEKKNPAFSFKTTKPLFENQLWLWVAMGLIISLIGFFTYKMLRDNS